MNRLKGEKKRYVFKESVEGGSVEASWCVPVEHAEG